MKAFICRGLPGTGKTYWASGLVQVLGEPVKIACADDFFLPDYSNFKPSRLPEAHRFSRDVFRAALRERSSVVCANTNMTIAEMAWYAHEAADSGAQVFIVDFDLECPFEIALARQKHLPDDRALDLMRQMQARKEALPPYPPFGFVTGPSEWKHPSRYAARFWQEGQEMT